MSGELVVARGARAAEQVVREAVRAWSRSVRAEPARLARPLRIVVPSRSLREHLAAVLVRDAGGSLAGVAVHTLRGLAFELLRRAGGSIALAEPLFPALVRRAARAEPLLVRLLDDLDDGYGAVVASVSDLLDAGLEPGLDEPYAEALDELGALGERARGVVRAALGSLEALRGLELEHRGQLFVRARETLEAAGPGALPPTCELWIHGYADATGLQAELLSALVRYADARLVLDEPPDPADPARPDAGVRFTRRLAERIEGVASRREAGGPAPGAAAAAPSVAPQGQLALFAPPEPASAAPAPAPAPVHIERFRAPGAYAEAREVAARVRALLDAGETPERIGIVARSLEPYAIPLRTQLRRLGVPFSGAPGSSGPLLRAGRELRALLDLLRHGGGAHADRWLDAWRGPSRANRAKLRVAFHALGAPRLRDVAALDLELLLGPDRGFALPVRRGFSIDAEAAPAEEEDDRSEPAEAEGDRSEPAEAEGDRSEPGQASTPASGRVRARRVYLSRERLAETIARARAFEAALDAWTRSERLAAHVDALRTLVAQQLDWEPLEATAQWANAGAQLERALASLRGDLAGSLSLASGEFLAMLESALRGAGRDALGGNGAGVAVLSVTEARARSFEHLFVVGLNRDLFPRVGLEDPLLAEPARRALEALLPDVPLKARAPDEERYLFAQLLSASPRVTLSHQAVTDDGKERTPSPLVERLRLAAGESEAPLVASNLLAEGRGPHTGGEHAVRAALRGTRAAQEHALALALDDALEAAGRRATRPAPAVGGKDLARARIALLRELERAPSQSLGPFFGQVGERGEADPRDASPSITALERLAACGWQAFLERVLRLEPAPDSRSVLPGLSPLLLGNLVHRVLEQLVVEAGAARGEPLARALASEPRAVRWPAPAELAALIARVAPHVTREAGIRFPGFTRLLAARATAALERVREIDFASGAAPGVLGAEVQGEVELAHGGSTRRVSFRADRVDLFEGRPRLTDYKTGKPLSESRRPETRARRLLGAIQRGQHLQAAAYAFASGGSGRYLYARPRVDAGLLELSADAEDEALRAAFDASVGVLLDAWDAGAFAPRLLDLASGATPSACGYCAVAEACVQGDSGARARLRHWLEEVPAGPRGSAEARARALFALGSQT